MAAQIQNFNPQPKLVLSTLILKECNWSTEGPVQELNLCHCSSSCHSVMFTDNVTSQPSPRKLRTALHAIKRLAILCVRRMQTNHKLQQSVSQPTAAAAVGTSTRINLWSPHLVVARGHPLRWVAWAHSRCNDRSSCNGRLQQFSYTVDSNCCRNSLYPAAVGDGDAYHGRTADVVRLQPTINIQLLNPRGRERMRPNVAPWLRWSAAQHYRGKSSIIFRNCDSSIYFGWRVRASFSSPYILAIDNPIENTLTYPCSRWWRRDVTWRKSGQPHGERSSPTSSGRLIRSSFGRLTFQPEGTGLSANNDWWTWWTWSRSMFCELIDHGTRYIDDCNSMITALWRYVVLSMTFNKFSSLEEEKSPFISDVIRLYRFSYAVSIWLITQYWFNLARTYTWLIAIIPIIPFIPDGVDIPLPNVSCNISVILLNIWYGCPQDILQVSKTSSFP